jgi:hypothetical protein
MDYRVNGKFANGAFHAKLYVLLEYGKIVFLSSPKHLD